MKRIWIISQLTKTEKSLLQKCSKTHKPILKPSPLIPFSRNLVTKTPLHNGVTQSPLTNIVSLFTNKCRYAPKGSPLRRDLVKKVSVLKKEILRQDDDVDKVLEENGVVLFKRYSDGSALIELLAQLEGFPSLAMEVFGWRRKCVDIDAPMTVEEYTKGIKMARRLKNVDLAVELFKEASDKKLKSTSLYNALMSAYTCNGLTMKGQSLFWDLKKDPTCTPSVITYNILIQAFGRLMLVDHMESALRELKDLNLTPDVRTYKFLISGYITAWMWEEVEKTYHTMKAGPIKPNINIHLLMLQGYANSGKLEKMEEMYDMVKAHVDQKETPLIRTMIRAYCRSSYAAKVEKVEELLKLIPENEYRPWLNVMVICLYAREGLLEQMETSIDQAFEHKAYVTTVGVMRAIINNYYNNDAVDKLANFVARAEAAGWKICRSLYHCTMVMYASERRLSEMERVLGEMNRINMPISRKTFWLLYTAYEKWGERCKLEQVTGIMCKYGYFLPLNAENS